MKKRSSLWKRVFVFTVALMALSAWSVTGALAQPIPGGSLSPTAVPKYVTPLVKPPVMRNDGKIKMQGGKNALYYEIAVKEFDQQILPAADALGTPTGLGMTTVWSYGPADKTPSLANGYFYPAFTLENKFDKPTVVKWVNGLGGLSHLLPVDQTLHWANPVGTNPDTRGTDQAPYTGPVPMVVHVHGAHTFEESDGYPEAWWLPAGSTGVTSTVGSKYDDFKTKSEARLDMTWDEGTAVFDYPNDQRATTLWYHDHTLGMTRLNVYAGPAGFYLIRGGPDDQVLDNRFAPPAPAVLPGPAPGKGLDPFGTFYEIPIAIQDRSFNANGSLFYPDNRAFFEVLNVPGQPAQFPGEGVLDIPFIPDPAVGGPSDVAPIWQPEFFGNHMVVNGQTWPVLDVEPRQYRFRFLNGCNSRFLILVGTTTDPATLDAVTPAPQDLTFHQIGAEGGFLPTPVPLTELLMAPAERADVIVDFSGFTPGQTIYLTNEGPDEPFGGGIPGTDFDISDASSTRQVMLFRVVPLAAPDDSTPVANLVLPPIVPLPAVVDNTRQVSLNEEESQTVFVREVGSGDPAYAEGSIVFDATSTVPFGPTAALLGTWSAGGGPVPLLWSDGITENPTEGTTEIWEIFNFTADAHPIHIHLVQFEVVDRQALAPVDDEGVALPTAQPVASSNRLPEVWETGFKDTVIVYPAELTRVKARFDIAGLYVWHCHIVEHEDNEMMRPYEVVAAP